MNAPILTRRNFVKGTGGIVLAFSLRPLGLGAQGAAARLPGSLQNNRMLDAWIRINADGTATVMTGKVELGQGALTALAQITAEELDLPLAKLSMIAGDTGKTPDEGHTSGSFTIEFSGTALRMAGAEVRSILLDLAAKKLGVDAGTLKVSDGTITAADGRKVSYGELAGDADLHREATAKVAPKKPDTHRIVGQSIHRLDIPAKVTGGKAYVQDIRLLGMLHARVVRPPRYGAKLESFDEAKAKAIKGVVAVVRDGSFLGVIAEREEQAIKARAVLIKDAKWSGGSPVPDQDKLYDELMAMRSETKVVNEKKGALLASAPHVVEAMYTKPYGMHGSIGPSCALAELKDGKLTVWSHTQGVFPQRQDLSKALKMDIAAIRCIHGEGAGCYGHNGSDDVGLDAALLARALPDRSIRVQWMRDDEHAWEPYGSAMVMKAKGSLDADNKIVDWSYDVWSHSHAMRPGEPKGTNLLAAWSMAEPQAISPARVIPQPSGGGDRNAVPSYDFPSQTITLHHIPDMPVRVSSLRTLGGYANVFASESFMDELALAAKADPVAFRLAHAKDPRARAVIEKVASMSGWKPGQKGDGSRGLGIAYAKYKNLACYVAVVAEVVVDRASGKVAVPRAWAVADAGLIINPNGLANQIEGAIIQSTSWTLHEQVKFSKDGILSRDWQSYPILTIPEAPKVEVSLINRPNEKPLGSGEGSQGPAGAAIANAFANATGKRLRDLPFTPDKVKKALG